MPQNKLSVTERDSKREPLNMLQPYNLNTLKVIGSERWYASKRRGTRACASSLRATEHRVKTISSLMTTGWREWDLLQWLCSQTQQPLWCVIILLIAGKIADKMTVLYSHIYTLPTHHRPWHYTQTHAALLTNLRNICPALSSEKKKKKKVRVCGKF